MIDTPRIVRSERLPTAIIRIVVPREEIQTVMGPAIEEVMSVVSEQGVGPMGPVYAHHEKMNPRTFEFAVGVPVRKEVEPTGRVERGEIPAVTVARTIYRGPYEGLSGAWQEFDRWIADSGHTPRPDLWERYLKGPESGTDANALETELNRPLIS